MRPFLFAVIASLYFFIACSKSGSKPPVQAPPKDTTVVTPPKDTTTVPPVDTIMAPPKDTATTPSAVTYKTMVIDHSLINQPTPGQYYLEYYDGNDDAQLDTYLAATNATLSSHNLGDITTSTDANTGDQLLTSNRFTDKTFNAVAPISDTSKFYYLLLTRNDTVTIIFPGKPIHYRNFSKPVTADDEKTVNNRNVFVEKLAYQ